MNPQPPPPGGQDESSLVHMVLDKCRKSRELTIASLLHLILIAVFGTAVLFEVIQEPSEFVSEGMEFVSASQPTQKPPAQSAPKIDPLYDPTSIPAAHPDLIRSKSSEPDFYVPDPAIFLPSPNRSDITQHEILKPSLPTEQIHAQGISPENLNAIKGMAESWKPGPGSLDGKKPREFDFVVFLGQYAGGNWNSTVRVSDGRVSGGSLPNLLWIINKWSKDTIQTNDQNVRVIRLDSDEIFATKPPFIFLTGSQDFVLTQKEVETLRKYVQMGGCIWGDSSLPGRNSRFDIAFRREMRRVIPDIDKNFEPLPKTHPIFSAGYFPEIKEVPPGLNFYQEPIHALSLYGEIAVLYTSNDYADMWQIGINEKGEVDLRTDRQRKYVAINPQIWGIRGVYLGNISHSGPVSSRPNQPPIATNLVDTYKLGTNIIVHLLTRWDRVIASAPSL